MKHKIEKLKAAEKTFKAKVYQTKLAKAVARAIVVHILGTPEKETLNHEFDHTTGDLTVWVEGRYKVTVTDIMKIKKGA